MYSKHSWLRLYGLILIIALGVAAGYLLGLRGVAERHLIDGGLALAVVLSVAWPSIARRDLLLEDVERVHLVRVETQEPAPIAWLTKAAAERVEASEGVLSEWAGVD